MHDTISTSIADAIAAIRRGGVIAYATEGVWGLGCDPLDETATLRLLALKQRPMDKGLILVGAHAAQFDGLIDWPALDGAQREAVLASWPGPNTWIVPATTRVPAWVSGGRDSVAVRASAHPVVAALCIAFGGALVSTSANVSTEPAPRSRDKLDPRIVAGVDVVVEGETTGLSQPTTIRDARTGHILR